MIITVNITNTDLEQLLIDISEVNKLTPEQYANNIVNGWLESQIRGMYKSYLEKATLDELKKAVADYVKLKG
jgi:hypothetical protein